MAFAAKNPKYVLGAMLRELTLADERFLAKITGASVDAIREYLDEPISSPAFSRHLRETEQNFRELKIMSADLYAKKVLFPHTSCLRCIGISEARFIRSGCPIPPTCRKGRKRVGSSRSGYASPGTFIWGMQKKSCQNCFLNLAA
jgi:hypothetical protein